jgi:hypothetical protein
MNEQFSLDLLSIFARPMRQVDVFQRGAKDEWE